jgi:adenosine kinase
VDTSLVKQVEDKFTASFFCSTDSKSNQIASFYTGAMANAAELSFRDANGCTMTIVSPNDPQAMVRYAEDCRTLGIPYIWDPGQQCARMGGDELAEGLRGSAITICNDYEFELLRQKTGLDEDAVMAKTGALIVTRGENESTVREGNREVAIPAVLPHRIVDPTGVGGAFRGGLLKGLVTASSLTVSCRLGSVAAAYAARAPRSTVACLHLGRIPRPLRGSLRGDVAAQSRF